MRRSSERAHLRQIVQSEVLPAVLDLRRGLPDLEAVRTGDVSGEDLDDAARRSRELADKIRGLAHDVLPPVLADRGLAAALRAHVRRLGADVTLAVPESHRLPDSLEAALYVCGRILVDAVDPTAGPVALTLAISNEDVHLAMTAPTGSATSARVCARTRCACSATVLPCSAAVSRRVRWTGSRRSGAACR